MNEETIFGQSIYDDEKLFKLLSGGEMNLTAPEFNIEKLTNPLTKQTYADSKMNSAIIFDNINPTSRGVINERDMYTTSGLSDLCHIEPAYLHIPGDTTNHHNKTIILSEHDISSSFKQPTPIMVASYNQFQGGDGGYTKQTVIKD